MIKNVSNISFGSVYKVSNSCNDRSAFLKFEDLCKNYENRENSSVWFDESVSSKDLIWHKMFTLAVDNSQDGEVETYCANHGIQFVKYSDYELTDSKGIKERIKPPSSNLKLVEVDSDKLLAISRNQDSNLTKNGTLYARRAKDKLDNMIKSGLEIPTSRLSILNINPALEDVDIFDFLENSGAENLESNQLSINFIRMTDEPDEMLFFAFREKGMKNIPLYMDKSTLKYAKALNILAH